MTILRLQSSAVFQPINLRGLKVACVVTVATILVGCGHKKPADAGTSATPSADASQAAVTDAQPAPVAPEVPVSVAAAPDGGADLKALNHAYIRWIVQTHQRAKTFEEFQTSSGINVPPPPAGKKYVIDHAGFIAIQNQ